MTHVDLDVLSSLGAVTSGILTAKGIGYVDGAVGVAIGGATMYHFVPSWARNARSSIKNILNSHNA